VKRLCFEELSLCAFRGESAFSLEEKPKGKKKTERHIEGGVSGRRGESRFVPGRGVVLSKNISGGNNPGAPRKLGKTIV